MKKLTSLNHITEVFFFFLFVIVCANIEDLYEPFLSFSKEGNIPFAAMYGLELLAFIVVVTGIGKFVYNARKRRFFTKENYLLFYGMGIALFAPGFVHFIGQILGRHAGADMHVEAAKAHLLELLDLPAELVGVQLVVPCPEGRGAVFAGRVLEGIQVQLTFLVLGIKHMACPP